MYILCRICGIPNSWGESFLSLTEYPFIDEADL